VPSADGQYFDALAVVPDGGGPGILLLQEIFGVGEFIVDRAERLAAAGYVVLAPDVFWRVEPGVALGHDDDGLAQAFSLVGRYMALDPATNAADLRAALAHLRSLPEVTGPVAVLGYCLGGTLAFALAADADPDACVSYYGSGVAGQLDRLAEITCPLLFHFGGQDSYIPAADVEAVATAAATRPGTECHVQPGAGHAFENLYAPAFADPAAEAVSWPLTVDFLGRALRSRAPG
jgi:carboxymethylenebutenolidase